MKYQDLIEQARAQEVPEKVGPELDDVLMAAGLGAAGGAAAGSMGGGAKGAWWLWLLGGVVVAVGLGGVATRVGGAPTPVHVGSTRSGAPASPATVEEAAAVEVTPPEPDDSDARPVAAVKAAPREVTRRVEDPEELYRQVEAHLEAGERRAARKKLAALVRRHRRWRGHATALLDLAHLDEQLGDAQRAYCGYRRFVREHGTDALRAQVDEALERLERAGQVSARGCP